MSTAKSVGPQPKLNLNRKRILIADDDALLSRRLAEHCWNEGYDARVTRSVSEVRELIEFWKPDVLIIDLLLPETNAFSLFRFLSKRKLAHRPRIVVTSRKAHKELVEQIHRSGAHEYMSKPFSLEQLLGSIGRQLKARSEEVAQNIKRVEQVRSQKIDKKAFTENTRELHLLNLFMQQATTAPKDSLTLHNLMRMLSLRAGAQRVSIIQCKNDRRGVVLAANDDALISGYVLNLHEYPEVAAVIKDQKPRFIYNTHSDKLLASVREKMERTPFRSMAVFPLFSKGEFFGVISLRMDAKGQEEAKYIQNLGRICSDIISLTIGFHA